MGGGGGGMFFSDVEGHMQKLSSFGRGKKFGLKSHLHGSSTQPFIYYYGNHSSLFQIGTDPKEARYWLRQFQNHESAPDQPFAVVQVDSGILDDGVMVS